MLMMKISKMRILRCTAYIWLKQAVSEELCVYATVYERCTVYTLFTRAYLKHFRYNINNKSKINLTSGVYIYIVP